MIIDKPLLPPEVQITANFAYLRWLGRGKKIWYDYHYNEEELKPWVPRLKEVASKVDRIFGYFNNHFHGYAVENCIQILEMLGEASNNQITIKNKIVEHNLRKKI